jgi:hypothetical protein
MSLTKPPSPVPSLKEQMVRESCSMVRHLVTNGVRAPATVIQAAEQFETALEHKRPIDMAALAGTHERLSRLVAPAKPGTLYLLDTSFHQLGIEASSLGPIKLVRDLVKVAMVCVAVFIVLSVLSLVEAHPDIALFSTAPGKDANHGLLILQVILVRVFWLAAAGIGASFAMLFTLNDQIVSRTYDPDESASYWVKFFLGVVAGFILVALVPVDTSADTGAEALGPPTIAMLGGFSASAVYRILTRMVEALESVFSGGAREQAAMAEKVASARAAEELAQSRMTVATRLVEVQQQVADGASTEQVSAQLKQLTALVMSSAPIGDERAQGAARPDKVPALAVVSAPEDAAPAASADAEAEQPAAVG